LNNNIKIDEQERKQNRTKQKKKEKNIHFSHLLLLTTIQQHNLSATCSPSLLSDDPTAYTC
jgi:hypothetical protein